MSNTFLIFLTSCCRPFRILLPILFKQFPFTTHFVLTHSILYLANTDSLGRWILNRDCSESALPSLCFISFFLVCLIMLPFGLYVVQLLITMFPIEILFMILMHVFVAERIESIEMYINILPKLQEFYYYFGIPSKMATSNRARVAKTVFIFVIEQKYYTPFANFLNYMFHSFVIHGPATLPTLNVPVVWERRIRCATLDRSWWFFCVVCINQFQNFKLDTMSFEDLQKWKSLAPEAKTLSTEMYIKCTCRLEQPGFIENYRETRK